MLCSGCEDDERRLPETLLWPAHIVLTLSAMSWRGTPAWSWGGVRDQQLALLLITVMRLPCGLGRRRWAALWPSTVGVVTRAIIMNNCVLSLYVFTLLFFRSNWVHNILCICCRGVQRHGKFVVRLHSTRRFRRRFGTVFFYTSVEWRWWRFRWQFCLLSESEDSLGGEECSRVSTDSLVFVQWLVNVITVRLIINSVGSYSVIYI